MTSQPRTVKRTRGKSLLLDLFGEVPVTREDVYAWLLAVVELDPASHRAADYVRNWGVVQKIVNAKLAGTFDDQVQPVKHSARLRELADAGQATDAPGAPMGLGHRQGEPAGPLMTGPLRAPRRPRAEIERERQEKRQRRELRAQLATSALARLPTSTPPLSMMLEELGSPSVPLLASVLGFSASVVRKWIAADQAPAAILASLFRLTTLGQRQASEEAFNRAHFSALQASALRHELQRAKGTLRHLASIADFGAVNDPSPLSPLSAAPAGRPTSITITGSAECAASDAKIKCA